MAVDFLILEGDNQPPQALPGRHGVPCRRWPPRRRQASARAGRHAGRAADHVVEQYAAAGGALASVALVACVMWVAVFDGVGFHERGRVVIWAECR